MTDVEEHEPRGNLVACALVIFLVDLACTKKLFAPALIGTSNGAGWAGWMGTLLFTGLAGFGLAERHRCCIAKRHRAAAANRSLLLTGRVNAAHAGQHSCSVSHRARLRHPSPPHCVRSQASRKPFLR